MSIDELDDFNDLDLQEQNLQEELDEIGFHSYLEENSANDSIDDDFVTALLKSRGIEDPSKIKFESEDGQTEEINWKDLTPEERLNIINTSYDEPERDLDDSEIGLINILRTHGLSPEQYILAVKQQAVAEFWNQNSQPQTFKIDDLSDDELFVLDLETRNEDITDEEAAIVLENAKNNEELFKKLIKGIRDEYQRLETELLEATLKEQEQALSQQRLQFQDSILDSIRSFSNIGGLDIDLDVDDMNELASSILDTDATGMSKFSQALNTPEMLVKMAWFALTGEQAIEDISNYYKNEIKKVSREQYNKGLEDGKQQRGNVVFKPRNSQQVYNSIDDLD